MGDGKLVRNLDTEEHRAWWAAVLEAAKDAPRLTWEDDDG